MTTRPRQNKSSGAGNPTWIALLSQCIDSIDDNTFPQNLTGALKSLTEFDNSVGFAYYQSEKPLCLFHTFSTEQQAVFVDDYVKGPYLLDPFFKACSLGVDSGLFRLRDIAPDRFYQSEYYRSYYIRTGLAEEICYILHLPNGVAAAISLMRSGERSRFSSREFRLLESASPVVISLARRHWQNAAGKFDIGAASGNLRQDRSMIENTVAALFSQRITPRETQVVAQVLEGHSSDSIARSLGISVGTVRIHRRNIYAKLQISSQQELFSIFFKNLTTGRR